MYARGRGITRKVIDITSFVAAALLASFAYAQDAPVTGMDVTPQGVPPGTTCDTAGIGQAHLVSDLPTAPSTNPPNDTSVTITSVSTGTTGGVPYCLVRLLIRPAINIWVGLPMGGAWNGRLQSEGGGGYAGSVGVATGSIAAGYIGIQTDTGHTGGSGTFGCVNDCAGATQASPGAMDKQRQADFAYRSEHLMAVLGQAACAGVSMASFPCTRTGTAARPAGARVFGWHSSSRTITTAFSPARRRYTGIASRPTRSGRRWRGTSKPGARAIRLRS